MRRLRCGASLPLREQSALGPSNASAVSQQDRPDLRPKKPNREFHAAGGQEAERRVVQAADTGHTWQAGTGAWHPRPEDRAAWHASPSRWPPSLRTGGDRHTGSSVRSPRKRRRHTGHRGPSNRTETATTQQSLTAAPRDTRLGAQMPAGEVPTQAAFPPGPSLRGSCPPLCPCSL